MTHSLVRIALGSLALVQLLALNPAWVLSDTPVEIAPDPLRFSASGLEDLCGETPFTVEAVAEAMPVYRVVPAARETAEGERYSLLRVFGAVETVASVIADDEGTHVGTIETSYNSVVGPTGVEMGMSFTTAQGYAALTCEPGAGETRWYAVCREQVAPNLAYLFGPRTWDGPEHRLPADEILADWKLRRMIWTAPDSAP